LTEAAKQLNVSFQLEAKPNLHDRELVIDTGWEIPLGRGLDIYQRADSLSLEANEQSLRAAKAFLVSYHFDEKLKNA
jgi:ATP-dependent Lon protease